MSLTDACIDAWLARARATPRAREGERVLYVDPRTRASESVTIVHVSPLTPLPNGGSEPASITIAFDDGRERDTVLANLTPPPPPTAAP